MILRSAVSFPPDSDVTLPEAVIIIRVHAVALDFPDPCSLRVQKSGSRATPPPPDDVEVALQKTGIRFVPEMAREPFDLEIQPFSRQFATALPRDSIAQRMRPYLAIGTWLAS